MKCPYCGREMIRGQLRAVGTRGPSIRWKDLETEFRLNDEPKIAAAMNGDRMTAYRCVSCKKIMVDCHEEALLKTHSGAPA